MQKRSLMQFSALAVVAALLYSSWPLGFLLNPRVARTSLASGLEALRQPYNWLFVAADILSSLIVVVLCLLLWNKYRKQTTRPHLNITLFCVVFFAFGTVVDALLPEHCVPNLMRCPSFTQDHYLLFHGLFSIAASVMLFVALFMSWSHKPKSPLLGSLLVGYVAFGLLSLAQAVTPTRHGNWSQDYYMTLCSLWLACLPYAASQLAKFEGYARKTMDS